MVKINNVHLKLYPAITMEKKDDFNVGETVELVKLAGQDNPWKLSLQIYTISLLFLIPPH